MTEYKNYLLTEEMDKHIDKIIDSIFTRLVSGHKDKIKIFTRILIDTIGCKLNFTKKSASGFFQQLSQNGSRDIISIMYLILPYINDANNYELYKQIVKLEDITCKKKSNNVESNNYVISNFQFSRYFPKDINTEYIEILESEKIINDMDSYFEYKYSLTDLEISFKLVLSTVDQIISRLYVNWINIIPLTLEDYKESEKYKQSMYWDKSNKIFMCPDLNNPTQSYPFNFWNLDLNSELRTYGGMTAGDVFNTICVFLFGEIYKSGVKWLLYEKQLDGSSRSSSRPKMYLEMIDEIVPIDYLCTDTIYDIFDTKEKKSIEQRWTRIVNEVISNSESQYSNFIKTIVLKFDSQFCTSEISETYLYDFTTLYTKLDKKRITEINIGDENFLEDENDRIVLDLKKLDYGNELYLEYVDKLKSFVKIPFEVVYEFLVTQIKKFKLTWYGKNIIKLVDKKYQVDSEVKFSSDSNLNSMQIGNKTYYPTYKNIYNYAKSISIEFIEIEKGVQVTDARTLNLDQKKLFIEIINRQKKIKFNISNVLKKTYGSEVPVKQIQDFIVEYFLTNLKDIVFISWIQLGLLNRFEIDSSITDELLLGDSETSRKVNVKKKLNKKFLDEKIKNKLLNTYYYLTGDKYSNLEIYNAKGKQRNWFETTFEDNEPWYYSFAMNWVSQINFMHHFIYNRVMFVTGATGQGKSTEVPKLLYYAVKAVNLNFSARVVSTQPTVIPTIKNAKIIATNLGVPIEINGYNTSCPYLQYSTQEKKHLVAGSNTFIKEVTDRTLFEEIIQNPYLKRVKDKKKNTFSNENVYDVVIIDEAHMHNINMDLILTFMRNVVNINNQIKLIITSATMDDDEYIYRRYYKILDDNYGYPISPIMAKLEYTEEDEDLYILDKIVVDRRYHISPPGLTTKYKVIDIYLESDTSNYEEAESAGLKILDQILKKNTTGDVLFFTTTEPAINKLVELINRISPPYAIALPLYGALKNKPGNWFDQIENIDKNLSKFVYSKSQLLDVIDGNIGSPTKVPQGTYTMAIIVATNIVEASVTIPTLRFVIDTGYFNSVVFDDEINDQSISIDQIPEASRLQRRGRVGRVAPGTVYYTYAKGARAHIKPRYGIVTADVTYDLFKILHVDTLENSVPIYDINYHPINFRGLSNEWEDFILNEPKQTIKNIYMNQYSPVLVNDHINPFQKKTQYKLNSPYSDGYTMRELLDLYGDFFIIHPDEDKITRNVITGGIRNLLKNQNMIIKKYHSRKLMRSLGRLVSFKYLYVERPISTTRIETDYIYIKKLPYYKLIDEVLREENETLGFLMKKYKEDDILKIFKTLICSYAYGCEDEVLKIISLMYSIDSYKTFVAKQKSNPKFNDYDGFIGMWENSQSELFSYLSIMNFFVRQSIIDEEKDKNIISQNFVSKSFTTFSNLLKKYGNKIYLKDKTSELELNGISQFELLNYTKYKNNNFNFKKIYSDYSSKKKIRSIFDIKDFDYSSYCDSFFINTNTILSALRLYHTLKKIMLKDHFIKAKKEFKEKYPVIRSIELNKKENIIKCFLESYAANVCIIKKNGEIINTSTNNKISLSGISLVKPTGKIIFYGIKSKDGLLGLTKVPENLFDQVIPINIFDDELKYFDEEPQDISNITKKYKYLLNKPNVMNINIDGQVRSVKVRRYRITSAD